MEIVSGRTGSPHVTSQQFRQLVEGTVGQESYILTSGENLEPELASNNILKIRSGMMSHHGNISSIKIGTYDEVELTNGSQGMKRIDLVVNRYTRNAETNVEANNWVVITGMPVASDPAVPAYTVGNLQEGDLTDDCPVFEVHYDGLNITEVKKLLDVADNLGKMKTELAELNGKSGKLIENQIDYQEYTLLGGKVKVISGSVIRNGAGKNYIALFTAEQLKDYFGVTVNTTRLSISTFNGDDASQAVQFYAPENWQGSIYQYFSAVVSGSIRINYRMVYVYE